jgi:hypothetical protein
MQYVTLPLSVSAEATTTPILLAIHPVTRHPQARYTNTACTELTVCPAILCVTQEIFLLTARPDWRMRLMIMESTHVTATLCVMIILHFILKSYSRNSYGRFYTIIFPFL